MIGVNSFSLNLKIFVLIKTKKEIINYKKTKTMKGILKIILAIFNLFILSRGLVCSEATPLYQNLYGVESCVKECDSPLIEFTVDNTCKYKSKCTLYLSSDKMKCTTSCGNDYVDLSYSGSSKVCSATCSPYMYTYSNNSEKFCNTYCPKYSL